MEDEIAEAMAHYHRATPLGDLHRPPGAGPVDDFPRLPPIARTKHPSQFAAMWRSLARLWEHDGDVAETLGTEARAYLRQHAAGTL